MHGVKSIETVLHYIVRATFSAAVKPDWNECKYRKALSCNVMCFSEKLNGNLLTLKEDEIHKHHCNQLCKPGKRKIAEEIKHDYCQEAPEAVVGKAYESTKTNRNQNQNGFENLLFCFFFSCLVNQHYCKQTEKQGKHNILVIGIKPASAVKKIERNL